MNPNMPVPAVETPTDLDTPPTLPAALNKNTYINILLYVYLVYTRNVCLENMYVCKKKCREQTVYYAKVFKEDLGRGLEILSDILMNSLIDGGAVDRERDVIIREMEEVNKQQEEVRAGCEISSWSCGCGCSCVANHPSCRRVCTHRKNTRQRERERKRESAFPERYQALRGGSSSSSSRKCVPLLV